MSTTYGYELTESDSIVALARRALASVDGGGVSTLQRSGGRSDANELSVRGIATCVLGIGADACHSVHERLSPSRTFILMGRCIHFVLALHPAPEVCRARREQVGLWWRGLDVAIEEHEATPSDDC